MASASHRDRRIERTKQSVLESHVREFDITGKPMKGWVMVEPDGIEDDKQLTAWIERAMKFVKMLPAK